MSYGHTRPLRIVLVGNGGDGAVANIPGDIKGFDYFLCHARHIGEMLTLSSENEFDVILLDLSSSRSGDLVLLERVCETFSAIPIVVLVENDVEAVGQRALRIGAQAVLSKTAVSGKTFGEAISQAIEQKKHALRNPQERYLEQALQFLQHQPMSSTVSFTPEAFGMKPLSEAMPSKFLELAKSYRNLVELTTSRPLRAGIQFNAHNVSRKLHCLASDLGALKAGVQDVIDIHAHAVESKFGTVCEPREESHKLLLELIADLVSYYRKSEYANA